MKNNADDSSTNALHLFKSMFGRIECICESFGFKSINMKIPHVRSDMIEMAAAVGLSEVGGALMDKAAGLTKDVMLIDFKKEISTISNSKHSGDGRKHQHSPHSPYSPYSPSNTHRSTALPDPEKITAIINCINHRI